VTDSIYYSYAGRKDADDFAVGANLRDQVYEEMTYNAASMIKEAAYQEAAKFDMLGQNPLEQAANKEHAKKIRFQADSIFTAEILKAKRETENPITQENLEIDPARIKTICNEKFQNTLIATKEFEERLQVIFKLGNPRILDLYINNLNKKMYEIDSMAIPLAGVDGGINPEFVNFYLRHDGGISIEQPHMKMLQEYFNTQRKAADMAAEKTYKDRMDKNAADDKQHNDIQNQISANDSKREQENFAREYDVNLTVAYRQLGKKRPVYSGGGGGNYYSASVTTTGWCNVDRYVLEATKNRTTLDYTDPETGKKAIIKYEPFSVTINNENNYEQVKVYLLADSLNSFMRVSKSGTVYSEKLNELFNYSLVVVAQKDNKWFWVQQSDVKPGNISVTLNEIEESQLRVNLDDSFTKRAGENFRDDLDAMIEQHYYTIALQERKKQEEIDAAIMPVIFPFYQPDTASPFEAKPKQPVKK
jgi:hypothetical protein